MFTIYGWCYKFKSPDKRTLSLLDLSVKCFTVNIFSDSKIKAEQSQQTKQTTDTLAA